MLHGWRALPRAVACAPRPTGTPAPDSGRSVVRRRHVHLRTRPRAVMRPCRCRGLPRPRGCARGSSRRADSESRGLLHRRGRRAPPAGRRSAPRTMPRHCDRSCRSDECRPRASADRPAVGSCRRYGAHIPRSVWYAPVARPSRTPVPLSSRPSARVRDSGRLRATPASKSPPCRYPSPVR